MNSINELNFNLIKALSALLRERNVSRAADLCDVTQSAMSVSLKKLRQHFDDPLLCRSKGGQMELTPFALALSEKVQLTYDSIGALFDYRDSFDPATAKGYIRLGMSDYVGFIVLPSLLKRLAREAPGIEVVQVALNHLANIEDFTRDDIDFAIGDFRQAPPDLMTTRLFEDNGIIVGCHQHPVFRQPKLSIEMLCQYPQVFVSLEHGPQENFILSMLREAGYDIKVALMTPHTLLALQVLPGTQLLTNTVTRLTTPYMTSLKLAWRPVPYPLRQFEANLYWQQQRHRSAKHQWFRALLKDCLKVS